ncbi:aldehyde dehydrogenase family protein [Endozoicomonas numazuensis]|uniref:Aldehyde dehydrogenase n=1 Tax=Endozoicomonas numazuensis TaxID=1137799 RepID=A0A081NEX6_9GAMM|nr:aldehyde dehydrogenase family protein [Endozoicomonas numazuensis]KEQ16999.1 aldehyde dehydrogenase [Endozoicomonas numazuensis]
MDRYPLLIPHCDEPAGWQDVHNPYDLSVIAQVATCNSGHIEQALTAAHNLFSNKDGWLPVDQRIEIFSKVIHLVSKQKEELAQLAASEGGKPLQDSRVEINRAIDGLKLCIDCMRADNGSMPVVNSTSATRQHLAFTTLEPIGVVVAVSAFNHPFNLIVHQVGPALAAGCPVIVKPSADTPLSCLKLASIFHQAGLPEAWLQVAITGSIPVAEHLVTAQRVSFFSFIGSARIGWMLRSKLAPGTRCALEHGGAAPVIIAEDADLDQAITLLAKGAFYHAGQVCVSTQRIYVHKNLCKAFLKGLSQAANKLVVGDPTDEKTEVGPLIRPGEASRVMDWVNEARGQGATVVCGGQKIRQTCLAPTLLLNPPKTSKVSQNEIFGPVACIYEFSDMDEAIDRANSLPLAFQAAIFSKNQDTILRAYKRLNASAVMVNQHTAFRTDGMPFAGLGESGLGVGGIHHTFRDMQIEKMLVMHSKEL